MSAFVGKRTLSPGESVGLLDLTGATLGPVYGILVHARGIGLVSAAADSHSFELETDSEYVTDSELLVKNYSNDPETVSAVAIPVGAVEGSGVGSAGVGRTTLSPGESVGLLALAGAEINTPYTLTPLGSNLSIVHSADDSYGFPLESRRDYDTDSEILVKNFGDEETSVSVLAVPRGINASGSSGGGGGAVDSVNGETGDVVLTLDGIVGDAAIVEGGAIGLADNATSSNYVMLLQNFEMSLQNVPAQKITSVVAGAIYLTDSGNRAILKAPTTGGENTVLSLPAISGTLALTSDVQAITLDGLVGDGAIIEYGIIQFVDSVTSPTTLHEMGAAGTLFLDIASNDSVNISPASVAIQDGSASSRATIVGPTSGGFGTTVTLPSSSGTLALKSDIVVPAPPGSGTYTLQSVDGVVSWISA